MKPYQEQVILATNSVTSLNVVMDYADSRRNEKGMAYMQMQNFSEFSEKRALLIES